MTDRRALVARAGVELALIVVGVLLAFQFEAMREDREARSRAQTQLRALRDDLEENRSRLETAIRQQQRVVAAQQVVLRVSNGDEPRLDVVEMIEEVNRSGQFYRVEPVLGAYDALLASGDLRMIGDPTLRGAIANFYEDLRVGYEDEELSTLLRTELIGAMSESTSFLSIMRGATLARVGLEESSVPPDFDSLFANARYLSYLALLLVIEDGVTRFYERLLESCDSLILEVDEASGSAL